MRPVGDAIGIILVRMRSGHDEVGLRLDTVWLENQEGIRALQVFWAGKVLSLWWVGLNRLYQWHAVDASMVSRSAGLGADQLADPAYSL